MVLLLHPYLDPSGRLEDGYENTFDRRRFIPYWAIAKSEIRLFKEPIPRATNRR